MPQDEPVAGLSGQPESIHTQALLAQVLERANLQRALKQVRQNKGAPGIDGMTVDELPEYLRHHWLESTRTTGNGAILPATSQAGGNSEAGRENQTPGHPHGVGPLHSASHCASHIGAVGTTFSSPQLRIPPATLGPSGRARSAGEHPGRLWLGGGHGPANLLRPGQSRPADGATEKALSGCQTVATGQSLPEGGRERGRQHRTHEHGCTTRRATHAMDTKGNFEFDREIKLDRSVSALDLRLKRQYIYDI